MKNETGAAPRRPIIGPFFLIALLMSAYLIYHHYHSPVRNSSLLKQPAAGKSAAPASYLVPMDPLAFVLSKADTLKLTERQTEELLKLQQRWMKERSSIGKGLEEASRTMERSLNEQGRLSGEMLKKSSAPYVDLSRRLAALRHVYWNRAMGVLTPGQIEIITRELPSTERIANPAQGKGKR